MENNRSRKLTPKQIRARKKKKRKLMIRRLCALAVLVLLIAAMGFLVKSCGVQPEEDGHAPAAAPTPAYQEEGQTDGQAAVQAEQTPDVTQEPTPEPTAMPTPEPTPYQLRSATILNMGDIVVHDAIREYAYDKETDTFDYKPIFSMIEDIIQAADYAVINVDGVIMGKDKNGMYNSFPRFNIALEMIPNLQDVGVDMITLGNNHALDYYWDGFNKYMHYLDQYGMDHVGGARTQEERDTPVIKEINGIRVGFLSYTTMTNAMERYCDPAATQYGIAYTTNADYKGDVKKLRDAGAEFVIVYMHWGNEYERDANVFQLAIARDVAAAGADVIVGGHPHVIQPIKYVHADLPNGERNSMLTAFSMGNILSNQPEQYRDTGYMFRFTIQETEPGKFELQNPEYIPTYYWTEGVEARGFDSIRIINCGEYLENPPENMTQAKHKRLRACWKEAQTLVGENYASIAAK